MTSLAAVSHYLPEARMPVRKYLESYGFSDDEVELHRRYFGFEEVRLDPAEAWYEQAVRAVSGLPDTGDWRGRVRYLIQARTMPVATVPPGNPLHDLRRAMDLGHTTAFCVTQHACASGLLAVDLAGKLLAAGGDPDALVLVLVGEKSFTASADYIAQTGVMGEGVAAVLVAPHGGRDEVLGYATRTLGQFSTRGMSADVRALFRDRYPEALGGVILAAVERAGVDLDDLTLILPHNVNRMSWARVLKRLGIRGTRRLFLDNLPRLGHCFGADPFINYTDALGQGRLRPGDHYLMTAVGLGATFSAMVLRR
jgi:3-oxoacyl-[acyl-carrier-protein] synthase-3